MTVQLLAFAATCLVVIVVPGPDFLLVLRNTVRAGRAGAAWTSAGILLGVFILGMNIGDRDTALATLQCVNCYRLNGFYRKSAACEHVQSALNYSK
ncbi:hypothetical protein [Citricoccus sp. NR2]|uniref:hypothetical protein n=1 Tax=Citricoccus sp. NR2 TaxID=3004095 RepID=UPI0022DE0837|nr:hypothetical protein [Citricoccus sp. NR2]WBL17845.1 hypothetical protein O1A05_08465 [Citricoccus sp. NR2]